MSTNPINGESSIRLGSKEYCLQFTWGAIAKMQNSFPDGSQNLVDPLVLADVIRLGLEAHHPEVTKEDVLKASPPLFPTIELVNKAIEYAMWGPDGSPKTVAAQAKAEAVEDEANPPKRGKKTAPATA